MHADEDTISLQVCLEAYVFVQQISEVHYSRDVTRACYGCGVFNVAGVHCAAAVPHQARLENYPRLDPLFLVLLHSE